MVVRMRSVPPGRGCSGWLRMPAAHQTEQTDGVNNVNGLL